MSKSPYQPPYTVTPAMLRLVAEIGEMVGRYTALAEQELTPKLRRDNRIRTIHASLAIEANTLSLEQVTAVIAGRRVLGPPREVQEVKNAFQAYETMEQWDPSREADLLAAHEVLMAGLVDSPGAYRRGKVGVFRGKTLVHMAPPAARVPGLVANLLGWIARTEEHPLVTACLAHYELEFIHPFDDGNGRMGRLWHTLLLRAWRPLLAYLPVETVVHECQEDYYRALAESDKAGDASPFVMFMLGALSQALANAATDPVNDPVTDPVARLMRALGENEMRSGALRTALGLSHRASFRSIYLDPALAGGWIERTNPESPNSPMQAYRLTRRGRRWLRDNE